MTAPAEAYRNMMLALVTELKRKYSVGFQRGDAFHMGANKTVYGVLDHIEELAFDCGIPREEIGLHLPPDPTKGSHD